MLQQALRYLYSPPEEEPEEEKEFDEPMQEISTLPVKKQKPKGEKEIILTEEEKEFDEPGKETYATPADITPMGGEEREQPTVLQSEELLAGEKQGSETEQLDTLPDLEKGLIEKERQEKEKRGQRSYPIAGGVVHETIEKRAIDKSRQEDIKTLFKTMLDNLLQRLAKGKQDLVKIKASLTEDIQKEQKNIKELEKQKRQLGPEPSPELKKIIDLFNARERDEKRIEQNIQKARQVIADKTAEASKRQNQAAVSVILGNKFIATLSLPVFTQDDKKELLKKFLEIHAPTYQEKSDFITEELIKKLFGEDANVQIIKQDLMGTIRE